MAPVTPDRDTAQHPTPILPPSLKHAPTLRLHLNDLTSPATTTFLTTIDTAHLIPNAINHILKQLYHPHGLHSIPAVRSVTLILRDMGGVAYTTGLDLDSLHKEIHVSLAYLSNRISSPTAFRHEAIGVITHEMVHCFQHNCQGTAPGGLIEGIADYVRLKAGLAPPHWKKGCTEKEMGSKWDEGYQRTAWFLEWLEGEFGAGTVSKLNATMKGKYEEKEFWGGLFGCGVEKLWTRYKATWESTGNNGREEEQSSSGVPSRAETEPEIVNLSLAEKEEADRTKPMGQQ
ncbi:uncharacterized protein HMPREF1541_02796 [Cyphellophora europaea CBS 101466]|uniref:Uncharacterized protein n=1 Tax=Cyphellophora europaea (strain CBS 101466) TaxID=1220924 RepID=W2S4L7_CYPE1|nr:uncharacterized protein HMPREF1541_02796 [Cyphellophora europaea CBS 101466]ETN43637.1 hypothetical protein HMPREF1541_02796 [Cyphellophora europaea CBS 101466]